MVDRSHYICMKTGQENKVSNMSNGIKREKRHESIKGDSTGGGNETVSDRKRKSRDKQAQRALWKVFDYAMILLKCQRLFASTLT